MKIKYLSFLISLIVIIFSIQISLFASEADDIEKYIKGLKNGSSPFKFSDNINTYLFKLENDELEKTLRNVIYVLIEQDNELDEFYVVLPTERLSFDRTRIMSLKIRNTSKKIKTKYKLLKIIDKELIKFAIYKINVIKKDESFSKPKLRAAARRLDESFSQIKLSKNISVFKFNDTIMPIYFVGTTSKSGKAPAKKSGTFLKTNNIHVVQLKDEKVFVQQGEVVFNINQLENLPPSPKEFVAPEIKQGNIVVEEQITPADTEVVEKDIEEEDEPKVISQNYKLISSGNQVEEYKYDLKIINISKNDKIFIVIYDEKENEFKNIQMQLTNSEDAEKIIYSFQADVEINMDGQFYHRFLIKN